MKKTIICLVALVLTVCAQTSCGNNRQPVMEAKVKHSAATEKTQPAKPERQETVESDEPSDEEMEGQSGMYAASDVKKYWKKRVIKVPGQKSDIVALFEAFYAEWPTDEGNRIVHVTNPSLAPEGELFEDGSEIDRKNGYVESAWYEGEQLGTISACVWKRKNGHKLFAVNFHVGEKATEDFLCFYDFDPAKRTLTPEESPVKQQHLKFSDKKPLFYSLPHEGKTLKVIEDDGDDGVVITKYDFDGQNLKFAGHSD